MNNLEKKVLNDISESVRTGVKIGDILEENTIKFEVIVDFNPVNGVPWVLSLETSAFQAGNVLEIDNPKVSGIDIFEMVDESNPKRREDSVAINVSGIVNMYDILADITNNLTTQKLVYAINGFDGTIAISGDGPMVEKVYNSLDEDITITASLGMADGYDTTPTLADGNKIVLSVPNRPSEDVPEVVMYVGVANDMWYSVGSGAPESPPDIG